MGMIRLTREQSRRIDQLAWEQYHIPGIILMEHASCGVAEVVWEMLGEVASAAVVVLVGGGNNGGDGLAAARHLHNRGAKVRVMLTTEPQKFVGDALVNWKIASAMGIEIGPFEAEALAEARPALMIDAIFGTGLVREPRPPFEQIVEAVQKVKCPVLSVDVPSGMDANSGEPWGACIRAARTVTFVAEKAGFGNPASREYTGAISVVDIGTPRELVKQVAQEKG